MKLQVTEEVLLCKDLSISFLKRSVLKINPYNIQINMELMIKGVLSFVSFLLYIII